MIQTRNGYTQEAPNHLNVWTKPGKGLLRYSSISRGSGHLEFFASIVLRDVRALVLFMASLAYYS